MPVDELVHAAQRGDETAFKALYDAVVDRVYALSLRLTANRTEAEECTQDVFVQVWRRLGTFRGDSAFTTWLHRLTVNVFLTGRRAAGRRQARVVSRELNDLEVAAVPAVPGLRLDLEQAIAALPLGARTVFVLHDVEGYQHQEIATMSGIAEGTSKAQLFRARRLLRELLDR